MTKRKNARTKAITPEVLPQDQKIATVKPKKEYTDIELLRLSLEKGMSYKEIETLTGMDSTTAFRRVKALKELLPDLEKTTIYKQNKEWIEDGLMAKLSELALNEEKQKDASLKDVVVSYGILHDKRHPKVSDNTVNVQVNVVNQMLQGASDVIPD